MGSGDLSPAGVQARAPAKPYDIPLTRPPPPLSVVFITFLPYIQSNP